MTSNKQQEFFDDVKAKHRSEIVDAVLKTISASSGNTLDWSRSWDIEALRPQNPCTGTRYRGINRLYLARVATRMGYKDPRWMTFHQAKQRGWSVRKGAKGAYVEKWGVKSAIRKPTEEQAEKIEAGLMSESDLEFSYTALIGVYKVFNGSCIKGISPYKPGEIFESEAFEISDKLIEVSEAPVYEVASERAYYSPGHDHVIMPLRTTFDTPEAFGATLFHELAHSTGHHTRLNRDLKNFFGSAAYAEEELKAELASVMIQSELGFDSFGQCFENEFRNACAYLASWAKHTSQEDVEKAIIAAVGEATDICDYLVKPYWDKYGKIELEKAS